MHLYDVDVDDGKLDSMAMFLLGAIDGLIMRRTLNSNVINVELIGKIYDMIFRMELKQYFS
ncbi:MAG: hypothetical protein WBA54_08345 [Acidaminobacteraceae bacterium]